MQRGACFFMRWEPIAQMARLRRIVWAHFSWGSLGHDDRTGGVNMNGTERTGADAWERGANADLDATCVTADGGAEEKRPTMRMIKEMITAPERESGSPSD